MTELKPDEKICPFCAETIKAAAVKCRYCHSDLSEAVPAPPVETDPRDPDPVEPAPSEPEPVAPASAPAPAPAPAPGAPSEPARSGLAAALDSFRLLVVLVVLCLVLAAVAGFAWWRAEHPSADDASAGPITSAEARDVGLQQATRLTQQVLSYDWKTLDEDVTASQKLLAPSFRGEYTKAMEGVKAQTVKNQVKLTADAVATSIVSAGDEKIEALVFVNQVTTAKGTGNQRLDQNRVLVTLTRHGGEWRVSKMDAF